MAFCTKKKELGDEGYVVVENAFITHFLPYADANAVKVYLYGLKLTSEPTPSENSLESMAESLDLTIDEVMDAFAYWSKLSLVELYGNPVSVRYLPVRSCLMPPRFYDKEKYSEFNASLQELYPSRMLTANEYEQFYSVAEEYKVDVEALLLIAAYCVNAKGEVSVRYIIKVAESWFKEGIRSYRDIEDKIKEQELYSDGIRAVFRALGRVSAPDIDDKERYVKWTKTWGYKQESLELVAKKAKSMTRLDEELDKFFRLGYFTVEEIDGYYKNKAKLTKLAQEVNKALGLYYGSQDSVIETYIAPWQLKGFEHDTIITVARYCFVTGIRSLEGMNGVISGFYKDGLTTLAAINESIDARLEEGKLIKGLLEQAGSIRDVTKGDRDSYRIWTADWGFSHDMLMKAAELAVGNRYPIAVINKLLSSWKSKGITTVADIPKEPFVSDKKEKVKQRDYAERSYSNEELKSVFRGFEEEDE